MSETLKLREAVNVPDLLARDRLVRRFREIREDAVSDRASIEEWNRLHPDEEPLLHTFEDEVIAWCDGVGPVPALIRKRIAAQLGGDE